MQNIPVVSAATAGVLILMQVLLALPVAMARRRNKQSLGDGGNDQVLRLTRRHGNLAENAAIFIVCFALFELMGGRRLTLEALCAVFLAGRALHAVGLSMKKTSNLPRVLGVVATIGVGLTLGVDLILLAWPQLAAG